jgi:AraC family transcriptional regulator
LLRDWLPQSSLQLDARPRFEHYPPDTTYDSKMEVFDYNLCIPVTHL